VIIYSPVEPAFTIGKVGLYTSPLNDMLTRSFKAGWAICLWCSPVFL